MELNSKQISNFWKKVIKTDSCWLWSGYKLEGGYGRVNINGKTFLAHRISMLLTIGISNPRGSVGAKGLVVMHKCDNPSCVNPEHLNEVTQKVNVRDAMNKGRSNYKMIAAITNNKRWGTPITI